MAHQTIVQDLPFDILERIFLLCTSTTRVVAQPDASCAPVVFCHICKWWRKIAMDSPRIWEYLNIEVKTFTVPLKGFQGKRFIYPNLMPFVNWWWANAKTRPMTVCIREPALPEETKEDSSRSGRKIVLPSIKPSALAPIETFLLSPVVLSAQALHFSTGHWDNFRIMCTPSTQLPHLQCLTLSDLSSARGVGTRHQHTVFPTAPRLRHVHFACDSLSYTFPTTQFTHLFISHSIQCSALRRLLVDQCPNLLVGSFDIGRPAAFEMTRIRMVVEEMGGAAGKGPLQVTNLRQLTLAGNSIGFEASPFSGLVFPSLTAFRIAQFEAEDRFKDIGICIEELTSGMPILKELHIPSSLLCVLYPIPRLLFKTTRLSLGHKLLFLQDLVLEVSFAITDDRIPTLLQLVQSQWFQPAAHSTRGRVQIELQDNSTSFAFDFQAEQLFVEEIAALKEQMLLHEIDIRRSRRTNWSWRSLPEDLTQWRDATGFYETLVK